MRILSFIYYLITSFRNFLYDKGIFATKKVSEVEIIEELKNVDSEFSKLFQKGVDMSEYVIDLKIFEMAKSGDINAITLFEKRKEHRLKIAKSKKHFGE